MLPPAENPEYPRLVSDPTSSVLVTQQLGLLDPDSETGALVEQAVHAVNSLLLQWFGENDLYYLDYPPALQDEKYYYQWKPQFTHGATMLAARIYRRRNSPAGVESFGELGPLYVQRNDPDIAILLGLGSYRRPAVG
jgi:hypothetical protein